MLLGFTLRGERCAGLAAAAEEAVGLREQLAVRDEQLGLLKVRPLSALTFASLQHQMVATTACWSNRHCPGSTACGLDTG